MWKYVKWFIAFGLVFYAGMAYAGRKKPVVIWKDCTKAYEQWKREVQGDH